MRVKTSTRMLAVTVGLALTVVACGGRSSSTAADPGITNTEITLGGLYPYSGPASAYGEVGKGASAYFAWVNSKGGVKMGDGKTRKITFTTIDDSYSPPKAVEGAHQLIEQDKVFALYGTLGTQNNVADEDYINQQKVPQLFVATGASNFGSNIKAHPWTMGLQLAYPTESAIYAKFLQQKKPNAKVAVLYQNDDYGKDYLNAFKKAIGGTGITIVSSQSYETSDPTVDSQVATLAQSGADTFFNITTPKFAAQAIKKAGELGWKPLQLLNSVSASPAAVFKPAGLQYAEGIYSASTTKDPSDPQWDNDPAMKQYKELLPKFAPGANPLDTLYEAGWAYTEVMVHVLEQTKKPTRQSLMDAARSINQFQDSLFLPGIKVNDSATNGFPVESAQIVQFSGGRFHSIGSVIDESGKTNSFVG